MWSPGEGRCRRPFRGASGAAGQDLPPGRVPPGQYVTRDFPVLSAGNEESLLASIQQRGMGRVEQDGRAEYAVLPATLPAGKSHSSVHTGQVGATRPSP